MSQFWTRRRRDTICSAHQRIDAVPCTATVFFRRDMNLHVWQVDHCEQVHGTFRSHIDLVQTDQGACAAHAPSSGSDRGRPRYRRQGPGTGPSTTAATSVDPIAVETEPIVTIGRRELLGTGSGISSRFAGNSGKRRRTGALASRPAFRVAASPVGARAGWEGMIALHAWRRTQVAPDPPTLTG